MKLITKGAVAAVSVATLVSMAPAAHADAAQSVTVRPGDFVTALSDTRPTGHVEFLKDGLHVWTEGTASTDKAAEYVAVPTQGIPSSVTLNWFGTQPQPGSQIVFDADGTDGNGNDYNVLVGEPTFYGDDFWLTNGSSATAKTVCPATTGGFGSACHGTLAQWQTALGAARVYATGFSLGSGVKGDGVLHDIVFGDTDYTFTSQAATTKVPVTGAATVVTVTRKHATVLKMHFRTDVLMANQSQGHKLWFKVTDNGKVVYHTQMGAAQRASTRLRLAEGTGKHKVVILKNGVVDSTTVVRTGK